MVEFKAEFKAKFDVYSPRSGHTDRYDLSMNRKELKVNRGTFSAAYKVAENGDPKWSGYSGTRNPLMNIFANDEIYAPDVVPLALVWVWQRWRDEAVTEQDVREGLKELFAWIDATARAKPKSKLWEGAF
jgi:integron cassette protein